MSYNEKCIFKTCNHLLFIKSFFNKIEWSKMELSYKTTFDKVPDSSINIWLVN